jgi:putative restriction endonuclease
MDSIENAGWVVSSFSRSHPFRITIQRGNQREWLVVYIWNITHGGRGRAADEFRIQITVPKLRKVRNAKTLLLGWDNERKVFAGFNACRYSKVGSNPSVQVKEEFLIEGRDKGISIQVKEQDSSGNPTNIVVVFRQEFLIPYILELDNYHSIAPSNKELEFLRKYSLKKISRKELEKLPAERERIAREINQLLRDYDFRSRVLEAYDFQCAICGIRLGMVEAAHIVPVKDGGTDETSNGVALCPNHHASFDRGIILIKENYVIELNTKVIKELEKKGFEAGLDKFCLSTPVGKRIILPKAINNIPKKQYLRKRLKLSC